ncbi:NINE protein [Entomospira nematocerorum]|uniref:NINE protein n=1 Tax=Entomospira nematocerorum TaxID=2719987 RepID=A0A968GE46_9SPIO|nr:NINE protein [Entomospira nematocera]NIZ46615.1 NINE protein [Entomospira nematocera]WDI33587.1 NINE protein [Entomospira nematocera]
MINYKTCPRCKQKIPLDSDPCPTCGNWIKQNSNITHTYTTYNKQIALIFCIIGLLGISGLHHFYTRRFTMGIIYLLTGGLFLVGTLVDIVLIINGNYRDSNGHYLEN